MGPIDTLWPDHEDGLQWSSDTIGGTRPKFWSSTNQPQSRPEVPNLVSHPHWWIHLEMLKIPHRYWWKTLMPCGQMTMFSHMLCKSLSESEALHLACWQAVVFQLPQTQQETAAWWTPPPTIPRLHLKDYMSSPTSSNFWIMRQQKILALLRALKDHVEESGFPTGILCVAARELQQCMTPLLVLNCNKIVGASLLKSIEGECGASPMPEEEASLLGDIKPDIELPKVPEQL